jgi:chemotaxis protein CheC
VILNERQTDALSEFINIAFARTASSLSDISGRRVMLDPPSVGVHPIDELATEVGAFVHGDIASIHQMFSGEIAGDALLMLNHDGALHLAALLTEVSPDSRQLDTAAREVLTEIGNILLNACLGMFGNLLHVQVTFSMPRLHLESLANILKSVTIGKEELRYAVVVSTAFRVKDSEVSGYLILVLGVSSLERLVYGIEEWEGRQGA